MQLIATGKWSKDEKRWRMVVALRPAGRQSGAATDTTRRGGAPRPQKNPWTPDKIQKECRARRVRARTNWPPNNRPAGGGKSRPFRPRRAVAWFTLQPRP